MPLRSRDQAGWGGRAAVTRRRQTADRPQPAVTKRSQTACPTRPTDDKPRKLRAGADDKRLFQESGGIAVNKRRATDHGTQAAVNKRGSRRV